MRISRSFFFLFPPFSSVLQNTSFCSTTHSKPKNLSLAPGLHLHLLIPPATPPHHLYRHHRFSIASPAPPSSAQTTTPSSFLPRQPRAAIIDREAPAESAVYQRIEFLSRLEQATAGMAILALPMVISFLKPQACSLSLFRSVIGVNPSRFRVTRRHFRRTTVSAISNSAFQQQHQHSSTEPNSEPPRKPLALTFSKLFSGSRCIFHLFSSLVTFFSVSNSDYWASVGCAVMQCSNTEVGAGTMNPLTFLRVLGPEPWNVAYVEPSVRPDDSRYGENPNRLQRHTQFQVILKPDPGNSQDLFIRSLSALGINISDHDIRFVEDNWESPVLGAWGLGWEIWMDGMEITQFTYFQQAGSLQLSPVSVEITYGLERILMLLQGVDHFKKIQYADGITYGELFSENEKEMSAYYLEHASVHQLHNHFDLFEAEARSLLALGLAIPAYDQLLKTSHTFNILDSRGFVGVTERARYFGRMRSLARQCAQLWSTTRESLGYPLGTVSEPAHSTSTQQFLEAETKTVLDDTRSFVLEIGTEELPPLDVIYGGEQLEGLLLQLLDKQRLGHGKIQAFGTPRRLVPTYAFYQIFVENLSTKQSEREIEVRGPPFQRLLMGRENLRRPLRVFAVDTMCLWTHYLERLMVRKTEYVHIHVKEAARLTSEILSEELPGIISKLSFPKSMRWNSQVMFSRPVRWIMALHGDILVPFTFAGVLSGKLSYGLRNTASAIIQVLSAESYASALMTAGINIAIKGRKQSILEQSNMLAKSVNGHIFVQENLLSEVVNLVEAPVAVLGKFKESFLELPDDLLKMVMQKHQKYFAIIDDSGKLLPYFIAVANGPINELVVREGNEAVLRARYEDAKFFYGMDTRRKFSEFQSQLKGILFHMAASYKKWKAEFFTYIFCTHLFTLNKSEKLGTMLDKVVRLQNLVENLGLELGIAEDTLQIVKDAASLAMSDLATAVVTEFTGLSGIMARHYALRDGYSEQAIIGLLAELFYFLRYLADWTALWVYLAAGCQPSSTNDQFGLRRISYGLVQILVEREKNLDLLHAIKLAAALQPIHVDAQIIVMSLGSLHLNMDAHAFVTRRLEQFLVDKGISPEFVRSVLAERGNSPYVAAKTAFKMRALSEDHLFPKVVEVYSRPTRIVRGKDYDSSYEVDETKFETNEERGLWNALLSTRSKFTLVLLPHFRTCIEVDEFIEISAELLQPLEDFFNNVFVMVEDESIRKNRLALLKRIADLPRGIADLSVLPGF
ncbi:unnamed protein product [Linum tenue]|uniref:glycine--tRNA ligase n=1 Tax=Linum tenue TaxID=586396 RepID=A0AAV0MJT8_9ROSI|nr:unnamed protein product [Linum tenue]